MLRLSKDRDDNGTAYQDFIGKAGFETGKRCKIISAAVGVALHKGAQTINEAKKATNEPGSLKESQEIAVEKFKESISEGVVYDNNTGNRNEGEKQTQTLVRSYYYEIAPKVKPLIIEEAMEADAGGVDGIELEGLLHSNALGRVGVVDGGMDADHGPERRDAAVRTASHQPTSPYQRADGIGLPGALLAQSGVEVGMRPEVIEGRLDGEGHVEVHGPLHLLCPDHLAVLDAVPVVVSGDRR